MDPWIEAEKWHFKMRNQNRLRENFCPDATNELFEEVLDTFAELHITLFSPGYTILQTEFLERNTRLIADTKLARIVHKDKILDILGNGKLRLIKDSK